MFIRARDLTARGSFSDNFLLEGLTYSLPLAANDARNLVMRELEKGNCFVLLDGLDELPRSEFAARMSIDPSIRPPLFIHYFLLTSRTLDCFFTP